MNPSGLLRAAPILTLLTLAPAGAIHAHVRIGLCAGVAKLAAAKAAGFDYVELPVRDLAALSDAEYAQAKTEHARVGLPTPAGNVLLPGNFHITGPAADPEAQAIYIDKALDRAAGLGLTIVVFGSGGARNVPEGFAKDTAFHQLIAFGRMAGQKAAERGMTLLVEALRREETNIINTTAEGLRLVDAVNHPNFQLMVDLYHLATEKEDAAIIVKARKHIHHFHIANPIGRVFPLDAREFDYGPFFAAIRKINYSGGISVEAHALDFDKDAPKTIALLRKLAEGPRKP